MKLRLKNLFKNERGVSLIQVIVAAGLTSVISLGVMQMLQNSSIAQRQIALMSTLRELQKQIETRLMDNVAFGNIIKGNNGVNPIFTSMNAGVDISENAATAPYEFVLYDASGVMTSPARLELLGPSDVSGAGFTEKGLVCSGFSTVSGNDNCPISYRLMVQADCARGASCKDPSLKLVARLLFSPGGSQGGSGILQKFRNIIPQVTGTSQTNLAVIGKYDVEVVRTATEVQRGFKLSAYIIDPASGEVNCATGVTTNTGGGTCATGVSTTHPATSATTYSTGLVEEFDPNNLVTVYPNGNIRFGEMGMFNCVINVSIFSTGGFNLILRNTTTGTDEATAAAAAGTFASSTATLSTPVNVTSTSHDYVIRQRCETNTLNSCTLGFLNVPYSSEEKIISVNCSKRDVAF